MEDLDTSTLLLIVAGLVVAFVLWQRSKTGPGVGDAPEIPVTGAPPVVPVDGPISRGAPPPADGGAPVYMALGRTSQAVTVPSTGPASVTRIGRDHF